jgi:hypothetical protein
MQCANGGHYIGIAAPLGESSVNISLIFSLKTTCYVVFFVTQMKRQ